jgi:hypothetical protein
MHVCAPSTESPVHAGPHPIKNPSKPPYAPPYLPCPKIGNLFLCRMIRPLTCNSQNVNQMPHTPRITKSPLQTTRPVIIAASTNEVAMWAQQLYIGLLPNFHSPFQKPKVCVFQTVFSHGISVPSPTFQ